MPEVEDRAFRVQTIALDLPGFAGAFGSRLRAAGLPISADTAARFAEALRLVRPVSRRRLYWTARAVFVTDRGQVKAFDAVFRRVFGDARAPAEPPRADPSAVSPTSRDERPACTGALQVGAASAAAAPPANDASAADSEPREAPVALAPSEEEVLRCKRFDLLSPSELSRIYELMTRMEIATPLRRTRRAQRRRHGDRIDMRRTLRSSLRTGGDPVALRRRRRRVVRRPIVLLCDISGSMEPYARPYLQFLTCAAGGTRRAEAFVFATRLTRVTHALASRSPDRAIQSAAAAAPDWSSGTRIGDTLKAFNDRHARRGMARGAVVVVLSDGWERGDPGIVGREMERLRRLAYRIVWVNPRAGVEGFAPRVGGMAAALPFCDALVSGHSLEGLREVVDAIAGGGGTPGRATDTDPGLDEDEPWGSATPVAGSSVAMPSGYGPRRGHTTPGWGL